MPSYMRTLEIQPRVRYEETAASIIQEIVHDGDAVVPINVPTILTKTRDAKAAEAMAKIKATRDDDYQELPAADDCALHDRFVHCVECGAESESPVSRMLGSHTKIHM